MAVVPASSRSGSAPRELAYAQRTTSFAPTQTTRAAATAALTLADLTLDGSTRVQIEFFSAVATTGAAAGQGSGAELYDAAVDLGCIAQFSTVAAAAITQQIGGSTFLTPSAGTHTYSIRIWATDLGSTTWGGTTTYLPMFLRVTTAPAA